MNGSTALCAFFGAGAFIFAVGAPAPWHAAWIPLAIISFLWGARAAEAADIG